MLSQRVGFARALAIEPELLLLDEPFSSLDIYTAQKLKNDLLKLWSDGKIKTRSMILVTHNVEEAVLMSDRVLVFDSNPGMIRQEIHLHENQLQRNIRKTTIQNKIDEISMHLNKNIVASEGKKEVYLRRPHIYTVGNLNISSR